MDSINSNQAEHNRKNLAGQEAIEKIKTLAEKADTCFFCTSIPLGESGSARPMSVQKVDESGNLWFLSPKDSDKNKEIVKNPKVNLYFMGSAHSDFHHLSGTARISDDKTKIKELWQPVLKTWFTEGENDPRISVIKVTPTEGYYWDTKHGNMVAGIKILIGAALGKTLDDSIEGQIRV